jgi:hypothetical protein
MRSYLTDLLRFTLFAVPVYIAFIILAGILSPFSEHRNIKYARGGYGHLLTRLQEADTTGPVDILFLGSSHAYRGFDPRVFNAVGFRTFNLGSSSQSPVQTRWLVDRYLERMKPKLVVMDVFPTTFTTEGIESTLNVLSNAPLDPALLRMALRTAHADACNTAILALWHELTNTHPVSSEPAWQPRDQDQWSAFLYIMEQLRAHNIPVILVQTPVTRSWQYTMEERAELRQRLEPHANAYLDLSDALNGDDALLFYDGHHMRQASVERFNTMFLDSLAARNLLPGH